jgi:CSLREA domain-containing protein
MISGRRSTAGRSRRALQAVGLSATLLVLMLVWVAPVFAAPGHGTEIRAIAPAGATEVNVTAVNGTGAVSGYAKFSDSPTKYRAFRWTNGITTPLGLSGGGLSGSSSLNSYGNAIDEKGRVFGALEAFDDAETCSLRLGSARPVVWANTTPAKLGGLEQGCGRRTGSAFGVNDKGTIWAGHSARKDSANAPLVTHAVTGQAGGVTDLTPASTSTTYATDVNASGAAYVYTQDDPGPDLLVKGGTTTALDLSGPNGAINDAGTVVGQSASTPTLARRYSAGGYTDLTPLGGFTESYSSSINNRDETVGYSVSGSGQTAVYRATLWKGTDASDLNLLLPPGSGWQLQTASDISDNGFVVGYGLKDGQPRAYLLKIVESLVVNTAGDQADSASDGHCDVDPAVAGDQCTLRAAIQEANAQPGSQDITFAIPGGGVPVISPATALPTLTGPVRVLGNTQSGGRVGLRPAGGTNLQDGLDLKGGHSTVEGMAIGGFAGRGLYVTGPGGDVLRGLIVGLDADGVSSRPNGIGIRVDAPNVTIGGAAKGSGNVISSNSYQGLEIQGDGTRVLGNLVGTTASGDVARGNRRDGVRVVGRQHVRIGGSGPGEGNVISGNDGDGIQVIGAVNQDLVVEGNVIGGDRSLSGGAVTLGNHIHGVEVHLGRTGMNNSRIGGAGAGQGNVIVNNALDGVLLLNVSGVEVRGNAIGSDPAGTSEVPLGNGGDGVQVDDGNQNAIIGNRFGTNAVDGVVTSKSVGTRIEQNTFNHPNGHAIYMLDNSRHSVIDRNMITDSALSGVRIQGSGTVGNRLLHNAIFGSGDLYNHPAELGIDLARSRADRGVTPNDAGDIDAGGNGLQNFPDLAGAAGGAKQARVVGSLNARPQTHYTVELFSSAACDPTGFGEGERFLTSIDTTTDQSGNGLIDTDVFPPLGDASITATATGEDGTSEFSACLKPGGPKSVSAAIAPAGLTPDAAGSVTVEVWCLDKKPCAGTVTLQQGNADARSARTSGPAVPAASSRTLGSARFRDRRGGGAVRVRIRLTKAARKLLAKRKRLNIVAKVKLAGRQGQAAQDTVTFVLASRRH